MMAFLPALWNNILNFPANLKRDLRPGLGGSQDLPIGRMRRNFVYHLHPVQVTERALHPMTTLGLGVISLTIFFVLVVSGIMLMVYYVPTVGQAYASMQDIQHAVTLGAFTRALHRWSAHAMLVVVLLHLIRVAATAGYRRRELNWMVGLGLGLLTLGLAFTGYLLPWDQRSFWAVRVAAAMLDNLPVLGGAIKTLALGGEEIEQAALLRFYMLHVALLPSGMVVLMVFHLWRIRKDGGLAASYGSKPSIPAWPHLVLREAIVVVGVLSVLCLVATFVDAPLGGWVDPHRPSNPEKAPWYFLWIQEMVSYSETLGVLWFPASLFFGLMLLPFIEREDHGAGRWLGSSPSRLATFITLLVSLIAFVVFYLIYLEYGHKSEPWLQELLNPAGGMILLALLTFTVVGAWTRTVRAAAFAGLVVMLIGVVGCVVVGLCRGPDWVFYWPWEDWPLVS